MKKCMSKYDFSPVMADTGIDYTELVTVPDQVLSMYDIYMKYASRGEIAGLANNIRPHVQDDLDLFDEAVDFVPEEDSDILQRSFELRMRQPLQAQPALEAKPQENIEESQDSDSKPQDTDDSGSGSE